MLAEVLLPTPVSRDGKNATAPRQANRNTPPLTHALLPTPTKADNGRASKTYGRGNPTLRGALLPTPTRGDSKQARNKTAGRSEGSQHHSGTTLSDFAYETAERQEGAALLPTPLANPTNRTAESHMEMREGMGRKGPSDLRVAAELTGAATPGRSPDGKKSPAPLLNPCFVEWMLGLPEGWSDPDCPLSATEFRSRLASSSAAASCASSKSDRPSNTNGGK